MNRLSRFLGEVRSRQWAREIRTLLQETLHQLRELCRESENPAAVLSLEGFWLIPLHGRREGVLSFARVLLDYAQKRRQYRGGSG